MPTFKIEVGETYTNELGRHVEILRQKKGYNLFEGSNGFYYTIFGTIWLNEEAMNDHKQNLICLSEEFEAYKKEQKDRL